MPRRLLHGRINRPACSQHAGLLPAGLPVRGQHDKEMPVRCQLVDSSLL